ncbi:alpha amylase C-terminal domain-containing protein [Larkinella insperata]|uniref:1,4-alpha-glucan branching enzyme n=1 Tax=Larkinella insperata TaxID=332158 RepID=A0ABW3QLK5_9BACT|nr:alpha amylase C-terminal domain-containing protein [Larkinella insperata]
MPASLEFITEQTPLGAHLIGSGATFRVWAPRALAVHACGDFNNFQHEDDSLLTVDERGYWRGFIPGVRNGHRYKFWVEGLGSKGWKRDPFARELASPYPSDCVIRQSDFPWHPTLFKTPAFSDWIIYQLHVGVFDTPNWETRRKGGTFLDVALKLPYLSALGVTALQLLPIQEFQSTFSLGYNGTDYFSPETNFAIEDAHLAGYLSSINQLLTDQGQPIYHENDLRGEMNQLKALVDLSHLYGIAVMLDVVYNHAGGGFGDESIYFFDRQPGQDDSPPQYRNSLYFTEIGHAGGQVFDFGKAPVREFLVENAKFLLDEYRIDGLRYDQVSVIDHDGRPHGWPFCQELTDTLHLHRPGALHHAEYWGVNPSVVKPTAEGGAGFDTTLTDGLRIAIRRVISQASTGSNGPLPMTALGDSLWPTGFQFSYQFVQGPENHDLVLRDGDNSREQRIARLSDPANPRSLTGRRRSRVATGLSLVAPGIPMLFMGQEFLEDKQWSDNLEWKPELRLFWAGLDAGDPAMLDHLRFCQDLIQLRRQLPGLRSDGLRVSHSHDGNRVLVMHRWIPGAGQDVVVVASLANIPYYNYRIGLPEPGQWREVFNSDAYENGFPNPQTVGNGGQVWAEKSPAHGFLNSAVITMPANGFLVLIPES